MSYARFDELGCEPEKEQVEKFSPTPGQAFTEAALKQKYRKAFKYCKPACQGHCISKKEFPWTECGTWKAQTSCRETCFGDRSLDYGKRKEYL